MGAFAEPPAPKPSPEEATANATFEALMWAMARPGETRTLPAPALANVVKALIDLECRAYARAPELAALLRDAGAREAAPEAAEYALLDLSDPQARADFDALQTGDELYPERGATVVAPARFGAGERVRISGPGVAAQRAIALGGLGEGFWAARAAKIAYPLGVDLILIDGVETLCVPRSSRVEAL